MSLTYYCPKCDSTLNPNVRVVLIARYGDKQGIVLMALGIVLGGSLKRTC